MPCGARYLQWLGGVLFHRGIGERLIGHGGWNRCRLNLGGWRVDVVHRLQLRVGVRHACAGLWNGPYLRGRTSYLGLLNNDLLRLGLGHHHVEQRANNRPGTHVESMSRRGRQQQRAGEGEYSGKTVGEWHSRNEMYGASFE